MSSGPRVLLALCAWTLAACAPVQPAAPVQSVASVPPVAPVRGPAIRLAIAAEVLLVENAGDHAIQVTQVCFGRSLEDLFVCFPTEESIAPGACASIPLPALAELPGPRPELLAVELHYAVGSAQERHEAMVPLPPARAP